MGVPYRHSFAEAFEEKDGGVTAVKNRDVESSTKTEIPEILRIRLCAEQRAMNAFTRTQVGIPNLGKICLYVGSPDCPEFYTWILSSLEEQVHPDLKPPSPPLKEITPGQMGNIGEAITVLVGQADQFANPHFIFGVGGACTPFSAGTIIGLDITIVYLDPNGNTVNDRLFIQEIKTTAATQLGYSKALIADFQKLLDTTTPAQSLVMRVSSLMSKLKFEHRFDRQKLKRIEDLAQPTPANCTRIRLLPTLIHDRSVASIMDLTDVMTKIQAQGWPKGCIEAWSISMRQLEQALLSIANRVPFSP